MTGQIFETLCEVLAGIKWKLGRISPLGGLCYYFQKLVNYTEVNLTTPSSIDPGLFEVIY